MIYPRLNRVRNGQRLSVELVNGLIKRTEYAGELLAQYKLLSGDGVTAQSSPNGTIFGTILPATPITDDFGFDFIKPNVQYTFPPFTAEPGELLGPGINISDATYGRLLISGGLWEHGVFAPDNGFVRGYSISGDAVILPIKFGVNFVRWISCGFGPTFPFTGGTIQWVTD